MKKHYLSALFSLLLCSSAILNAQNAVNFQANDCTGKSHELFKELDPGYAVVMVWVMPCGVCVSPSLTTYNVVRSYDTTYPGKIRYYLIDDYANTSCNSLQSWANTYNMGKAFSFSNSSIKMSDYGNDGMPKIVVIGGKDHGVVFNKNNYVNSAELKTGIDIALQRSLSVATPVQKIANVTLAQNPVQKELIIRFPDNFNEAVQINIYDASGRLVKYFDDEWVNDGNCRPLNIESLSSGLYNIRVISSAKVNPLLMLKN